MSVGEHLFQVTQEPYLSLQKFWSALSRHVRRNLVAKPLAGPSWFMVDPRPFGEFAARPDLCEVVIRSLHAPNVARTPSGFYVYRAAYTELVRGALVPPWPVEVGASSHLFTALHVSSEQSDPLLSACCILLHAGRVAVYTGLFRFSRSDTTGSAAQATLFALLAVALRDLPREEGGAAQVDHAHLHAGLDGRSDRLLVTLHVSDLSKEVRCISLCRSSPEVRVGLPAPDRVHAGPGTYVERAPAFASTGGQGETQAAPRVCCDRTGCARWAAGRDGARHRANGHSGPSSPPTGGPVASQDR